MITRRSDPRRVALLLVLVLGAVVYAVTSSEDGWLDVIRFAAGAVGGCFAGVAMRRLDDSAPRIGPIVVIIVAIIVAVAGDYFDSASIWLAGALAGMLVTVGFLYPLPRFRDGRD